MLLSKPASKCALRQLHALALNPPHHPAAAAQPLGSRPGAGTGLAAGPAGPAGLDPALAKELYGDLPACQAADWQTFASKYQTCGGWTPEPGSSCPADCQAAQAALGEGCLAAVTLQAFTQLGFNLSEATVAAVV